MASRRLVRLYSSPTNGLFGTKLTHVKYGEFSKLLCRVIAARSSKINSTDCWRLCHFILLLSASSVALIVMLIVSVTALDLTCMPVGIIMTKDAVLLLYYCGLWV